MANTAPILILGEGQLSYRVDGSTITPLKLFPLENGGVIFVGESTGGPLDPQIVLARFNSDGSLDSNFIARTDVFGGKTVNIYDAVEQPDGDIVVGGTVELGGLNVAIGLVRYHPDGTLDDARALQLRW